MESVNVDSEMDEILKEAQEVNSEGKDTSDKGAPKIPNAQTSGSGDSPNLIEAITLLQKLWQPMVQVVVDRQTLQLLHLSQIPIQDLLTMNT